MCASGSSVTIVTSPAVRGADGAQLVSMGFSRDPSESADGHYLYYGSVLLAGVWRRPLTPRLPHHHPTYHHRRRGMPCALRRLVRIRLEFATRDVVGVLLDVGVPFL